MEVFDTFPVPLRNALNDARLKFDPLDVLALYQEHGLDAVLHMIATWLSRI